MCCVEDEQSCASLIIEQMFVWYLYLVFDQIVSEGEIKKFGKTLHRYTHTRKPTVIPYWDRSICRPWLRRGKDVLAFLPS